MKPQGARNSALKKVAPVSRTARRASESASTGPALGPEPAGNVFRTPGKDEDTGHSLECEA